MPTTWIFLQHETGEGRERERESEMREEGILQSTALLFNHHGRGGELRKIVML